MPRMTNDREECPDRPPGKSHIWVFQSRSLNVVVHTCHACGIDRWSQWIALEDREVAPATYERKEDSESEDGSK